MSLVQENPLSNHRLPISCCIICGNEEKDLPEAIRSVDFVQEIVVLVDDRTTDKTVEVAQNAIAQGQDLVLKVEPWRGHVAQKNRALELAQQDWALCLDADERVSEELKESIQTLFLNGEPSKEGYSMARLTFYLGKWIRGGGWYPDRKLRLVKRSVAKWGGVDPHDHLQVEGSTEELKGDLLHYSYSEVADHIDKLDLYTSIAARQMEEKGSGSPVLKILYHPPWKFLKMYFLQRGFRDGKVGFILACIGSFYVFLKYAKLWELKRNQRHARTHGAVRPMDR